MTFPYRESLIKTAGGGKFPGFGHCPIGNYSDFGKEGRKEVDGTIDPNSRSPKIVDPPGAAS